MQKNTPNLGGGDLKNTTRVGSSRQLLSEKGDGGGGVSFPRENSATFTVVHAHLFWLCAQLRGICHNNSRINSRQDSSSVNVKWNLSHMRDGTPWDSTGIPYRKSRPVEHRKYHKFNISPWLGVLGRKKYEVLCAGYFRISTQFDHLVCSFGKLLLRTGHMCKKETLWNL